MNYARSGSTVVAAKNAARPDIQGAWETSQRRRQEGHVHGSRPYRHQLCSGAVTVKSKSSWTSG